MNFPGTVIQLLDTDVTIPPTQADHVRALVVEHAPEHERHTFLQMLGFEAYEVGKKRRIR